MMHHTGVKSVIFRKLFPWIERIGHQFRRRVPAMLNAGVKQKLSEPQASSFAAPQCASGWSSRNLALIFCYFGIKAKVEMENDIMVPDAKGCISLKEAPHGNNETELFQKRPVYSSKLYGQHMFRILLKIYGNKDLS